MTALDGVVQFFTANTYTSRPDLFRCENRGELNGRLLSWTRHFEMSGASATRSAIFSAILGELGNNSFDHNLGKWSDSPGCLVGIDILPDRFRTAIADRGQGIANSLRWMRPELTENAMLLKAAFEEIVSGRSPEQRGNGLKFVCKNFVNQGGLSLICLSSNSRYSLGTDNITLDLLSKIGNNIGTLICVDWKRQ